MDQIKDNNDANTPAEDKKESSGLSLETAVPTEEKPSEPDAPSKSLGLELNAPTESANEAPSSGLTLDTPAPEAPSDPVSLEVEAPTAAPQAPDISLDNSLSDTAPTAPTLETPQEVPQMESPIEEKLEPVKETPAKPMEAPTPEEEAPIAAPAAPTTPPVINTPSATEGLSAPQETAEGDQTDDSAEDITDDQGGLENNPPSFERRRSGNTMLLPVAALGVLALVAGGYFWMTSEPTTPTPMVAADPFDKWPPQPATSIQPEMSLNTEDTLPTDIAELGVGIGEIPTDMPTPIDALIDPESADTSALLDDSSVDDAFNADPTDFNDELSSDFSEPTPEVTGLEADMSIDQAMVEPVTEEGIDSFPTTGTDITMEQAEIDGDISEGLEIQETAEIIKPKSPSDDMLMSDNDFIELEGNSDGSEIEETLSFTSDETNTAEDAGMNTNEPDLDTLISAEEALIANQGILDTLQPPPEADTQSAMLNGTNANQGMTELPAKAEPAKKIGTDAIIRPLPRGFLFVKKNHSAKTPSSRQVTAQIALSEHRYEAAYQLFDTISAKKPRNEKALMGRAVSLHKLGRHNEAINAYQKVLTRNSKNLEALSNMLGILRLENPQAIIGKLEDLYSSYPTNDSIIAQLGITYGDLKKYDQALAKLNLATSLAPKNPSHALNKAVILDHMKQSSKAAEAYQHALALDRQFSDGQPSLPTNMIKKRLTLLR